MSKKYAVFAGRARRKEFWMFTLVNLVVAYALGFVLGVVGGLCGVPALGFASYLYALAALLPSISVMVRRLHDTGRSGWWYWIVLVPIVGPIVLLVFMCCDSQPDENQYGPNPKG